VNTPATTTPEAAPPEPRLPATIAAEQRSLSEYRQPPSQMATDWLTPTSLASALQLAELMAKCRLVPQHLQGSISDCVLVLSQAARWRMDPFAVAQATAVVKGKLCFEGKLVAAALVATGAVDGGLDYEFDGEGQGMSITITGVVARTGRSKTLKGTVRGWRTENGQWDKDPQSMLVYRGTRQWCRLFTPETILGVATPDEMQDAQDVVVKDDTPAREGVVPDATAPKQRRGRQQAPPAAEEPAAPPTTQPPADMTPAPPNPNADPRMVTFLALGKALQDSGPLGAASVKAVLNQLGVTKPQNVLASKLDEAIASIRREAVVCNVTLPAQTGATP
jgi:hypothetical protein